MSISDWSSDVCSSDLGSPKPSVVMKLDFMAVPAKKAASTPALSNPDMGPASSPSARAAMMSQAPRSEERREGKSGSVRVDLGGCRIIKKKITVQKLVYVIEANTITNDNIILNQ